MKIKRKTLPNSSAPLRSRKSELAIAIQSCFDNWALFAAAGLLACNPASAQTARNWTNKIPLPSGPAGQALVAGSSTIRQPQIVTGNFDPYQVNGKIATVTQTDAAGILRWGSFDVAPGYKVVIVQPSTSAILLNKVDGGAFDNKTVIDGMLEGKGHVYIYNPNGIIFGKDSKVDVNSLVATTLKIDDNRFLAGLIAPNASPIFQKENGVTPGGIVVEGERNATGVIEQAQLNAARGGRIMLIGTDVSNSGKLYAPDGQVILAAASDKVYLAAPDDVTMRGLFVEVGKGGKVTNVEDLGKILVERGNASLVGLAVNQNGTISATTSVQANGSIYLRARDGATKPAGDAETSDAYATRGGTLTLGANSLTEVLPDLADMKTAAKSLYNASKIELSGKSVRLMQDAMVIAPGGDVTVSAQADPGTRSKDGIAGGKIGSSGVYMERGATIDVAGTTGTELAMESNVISVELRGTELADVPSQRNSVLRGKTVKIDRRKGTPLANIQGWLDLVEYGVGESAAAGGTVTFNADQEVVLTEGAKVNVSGGQVAYKSGYVATTQLQSGRSTVDIGSASADRIYTGLSDAVAGPRNFEAGYSVGYSAGSVRFNAASLVLRGSLLGTTTPGARQRDVAASGYPKGGELIIGSNSRIESDKLANYSDFSFIGGVNFGGIATAGIVTPVFGTAWNLANADLKQLASGVDIDIAGLADNGFTRINAYTRNNVSNSVTGHVEVNAPVTLMPGGELRVAAQETIALNADINIPGGTVEAKAITGKLSVASGVSLDVAGVWTNDRSTPLPARDALGNPVSTVVTKGGSIALSGKGNSQTNVGLSVGNGASFDASGGAWQNAAGKITSGTGGSISLSASAESDTAPMTAGLVLGDDVRFAAYGLSKGGTLKLSGRNVLIGKVLDANPLDIARPAAWFGEGGFSKFDITAAGNLTVLENTRVAPTMDTWIANRDTAASSGGRMTDAFSICRLSDCAQVGARTAANISLAASSQLTDKYGRLWVQQGAVIATDPGATVNLSAGRQLTVDGHITNPGGTVNLLLSVDPADTSIDYRAERSIWLGATSIINVAGSAAATWLNSKGVTQGELLAGGNIRIGRLSGSELAPASGYVVIEKDALLDVSGTKANMTLASGRGGLVTRQVASAGGSIDIRAREAMLIEGTLTGTGGDTSVAGGSLSLVLDREDLAGASGAPTADRELVVLKQKFEAGTVDEFVVPATLQANKALGSTEEGMGYVLAETLNGGGFDRIRLKSQNAIVFDAAGSDVGLSARSGISLDAQVVSVRNAATTNTVSIDSAYVAMGNTDWRYQTAGSAATPSLGDGANLAVNAKNIEISGSSVLQGFATAKFIATEDIQLAGVVAKDLSLDAPVSLPVIHAYGALKGVGALTFKSTQLYPTTMSEFSLSSISTTKKDGKVLSSSIEFKSYDSVVQAPLSAAGVLSVNADTIDQNGVVTAPFGSIAFTASQSVSFGSGSVTSVAGSGTVPLGRVNNGRNWLYDFGNGHTVTLGNTTASNGVNLPEKKVTSKAPKIDVASGAEIDLSGGGKLYAYEFTAGPGGSRDILGMLDKDGKRILDSNKSPLPANIFAILPGYGSSVAPADFQYQQDGGLVAGDRVYLSGIPGLKADFYTLLPAHYALLPGAFSVSAASGARDMSSSGNYQKLDGSWQVAGYRGSATASDSRWSGFTVMSGDQVRARSAFSEHSADAFFASALPVPKNGGHIVFDATSSLTLDGLINVAGAAAKGSAAAGSAGIADISAPDIVVVADASQDAGGAVKLVVANLTAMGADSLMLGGIRDVRSDGSYVTVGANTVTLANNARNPLVGPEIILAAKDQVNLLGNSALSNSGSPGTTRGDLIISGSGADADGALVRVSGGSQVAVVRNAPSRARGTLTVEAGATIGATGSMNLDATKSLDNRGSLALATNAALGLGANRVSFGDALPAAADGLRLDSTALTALNKIADISLTSYSTFDLYGKASIGVAASDNNPATRSLSLRGAGIQTFSADATLDLKADTVRFDGGGSFVLPAGATATAGKTLTVTANKDIEIGSNTFTVKGFASTTMTAPREVRAVGKDGVFASDSALTVTAGRMTALTGASASIKSAGTLTLASVAAPLAPVTTDALAGKLTFVGQEITSSANVFAKSGQVKFKGEQGVTITGGEINASGSAKTFGSTIAYSPGGSIILDGGNGNVTVDSGATLDVSAVGADAGLLSVIASGGSGQAVLNGTLKGGATAGIDGTERKQGRFSLDVDQVSSFGTMNKLLNDGGYTESRQVRVRHGDASLVDGESIKAHDVLIAADNGSISIGGTINADGAKGGSIQLYASQAADRGNSGNVTLTSTAVLTAKATQAATSKAGSVGDGGRVVIGTATADGKMVAANSGNSSITAESGAKIDVSGKGPLGQRGTVTFRAPRVDIDPVNGAGSGVAIAKFDATVTGSRETVIEGFKTYTASNISELPDSATNLDAGTSGKMYQDALAFSGKASTILSDLKLGADVKVRAGVEVRSPGNLEVSVNETLIDGDGVETTLAKDRGWDLNAWRFNGQPGILTLRATDKLTIKGSISDGFVKPPAENIAMPGWALDTGGGASWSYQLVGGADLAAANPMNVSANTATGDVSLMFARRDNTPNDQPVALIRTGTGRIDIAAGNDVVLDSVMVDFPDPSEAAFTERLGATIYTAGRFSALESGFLAPKRQPINPMYTTGTSWYAAAFAEDGGAISITAGNDVIGVATRQEINSWLFRRGRVTTDASGNTIFDGPTTEEKKPKEATRYESVLSTGWWTRYDFFNQGIATFGGGDVAITAGRDISNLSVNVATSGQVPADAQLRPTSLVERGGGDITLLAGGDIRGGSYYVQKGVANLNAGGSVVAGDNVIPDDKLGTVTLRPVLAMGDGKINISAVGNVEIETAFNPTLVRQSTFNADASSSTKEGRQSPLSVFSTYSPDSAVTLISLAGDINLGNHSEALSKAAFPWEQLLDNTFLVYPSSFKAAALAGSINFENGFSLWSSPTGRLDLLAQKSVSAAFPRQNDGKNISAQPIVMLDAAPSALPSILAPATSIDNASAILNPNGDADGLAFHTQGGLHAGDSEPVRVIALTGDIVGESYYGSPENFQTHDTLRSPKAVEILAGRDIVNFGFKVQHLAEGDVSTVTADRDFIDSTYADLSAVRHFVSGPGRLDVTAGRDIDLGTSGGIVTRGNLDNPFLPDSGAGINLVAGAKPDYASFTRQFVSVSDLPPADQTALIAYMRNLNPSLPVDLNIATALTLFKALPAAQCATFLNAKKPLFNDIFFQKLRLASGSIGGGSLDLPTFDAVIASLYPDSGITGGNINVFGSQLKTARGGSINIFAPGGSVQAGLAEKPAWVKAKLVSETTFESDLGIYTIAGGNLQSLVKMDFLVNQGRVFTLGGGDITLVSQYGNIDAGKGAKTSKSTPPPLITTDEYGNTVVDISASISGSGIATLRTSPEVPESSVYPIAPRGIFDAGDAGIRSTGTVNIVAQTVLNANNISAAGGVSGAKTADTSGLGGAVAAPASTQATKTEGFANTAATDPNAASNLTVELISYGDAAGAGPISDKGQQPVTQCGQTPASGETDACKKKKLL
jgi:filamentous hemagglutinin family protein